MFERQRPTRLAAWLCASSEGGDSDRAISAGTDWQRHSVTFTPKAEWCYVLLGPDLRRPRGEAQSPAEATVWIDAVQLEASGQATPFVARSPIEIGLSTEKTGNVFDWDEPLEFVLHVNRSESAETRPVKVDLSLVDFNEETVWQETVEVPSGAAAEFGLPDPVGPRRGAAEGGCVWPQRLRASRRPPRPRFAWRRFPSARRATRDSASTTPIPGRTCSTCAARRG